MACRQSLTSFNHFNSDSGHCVTTAVPDGNHCGDMMLQPRQRASVIALGDSAPFHFQQPPPPGGVGLTLDVGRLPPPPQLSQHHQQQQLVSCRRHQGAQQQADGEGCSTPSSDITQYTNVSKTPLKAILRIFFRYLDVGKFC